MAWRLHFSTRPIRRLDILSGKPMLLAAWTLPERVAFFDLALGTKVDERTLKHPTDATLDSSTWQTHLMTLTAPNSAPLPVVRSPLGTLFTSADSKCRVLLGKDGAVTCYQGEQQTALAVTQISAVALGEQKDAGGAVLLALLDAQAQLHLYRGNTLIKAVDVGLTVREDVQLMVAVSSERVFVSDGQRIVIVEADGTIRGRHDLYYPLGALAPSPDGSELVVTDMESGVIRIYNTDTFNTTHQRFGIDLMADAKRAQLVTTGGVSGAALGPLVFGGKDAVGFAMGGTVCVTSLARMKAVPRTES